MDHAESIFHHGQHVKSNSGSIIHLQRKDTPTPINSINDDPVPKFSLRDKKMNMPNTNVTKIMRHILRNNAQISDSAKQMIQLCVTKYITFVTKKATERCQSQYRKIMNSEDLLWAIEELGFHDYVGPLTIFLQRYRHTEEGDLFTHVSQSSDDIGPIIDPGPSPKPTVEMIQSGLPSSFGSFGLDFSMDPNTNFEMFGPKDLNDFYGDGFGGGWSGSAMSNFDPSALFKGD